MVRLTAAVSITSQSSQVSMLKNKAFLAASHPTVSHESRESIYVLVLTGSLSGVQFN